MLTPQSQEVLARFQIRKSSRQKREFRAWLTAELEKAGWPVTQEYKALSGTNVIAGDPDKAQVLLTAHYDTQAVLPFPNFVTPRSLGWYLAYNLLVMIGFFAVVFVVSFAGALLGSLLPPEALFHYILAPSLSLLCCVFFLWWLFFGKANRHTVNDNTSGVITLLETALAMPEEDRAGVCLVFFDNEERGMLGSNAFAGKHKRAKQSALVLNFDCVSDGDSLQFFPSKLLKREPDALEQLEAAFRPTEGKTVEVVRGFSFYPSDNAAFSRACGVCGLKKSKVFGWYMDRIHTSRDTVLKVGNITLLRDGCLTLAKLLSRREKKEP